MPIEIRELIIKAQVANNEEGGRSNAGQLDNNVKQKLVQECVDMVMDIIKNERER